MSKLVPVPRYMVERKPAHGEPCNGCGVCCHISQCKISISIFGPTARPCPALIRKDNQHRCGIVDALEQSSDPYAALYATAAKVILGAGRGCDSRINGEAINHSFNYAWDLWEEKNWTEMRCAFHLFKLKHQKEQS